MYGELCDQLDRRPPLIASRPVRHILRAHIVDDDAYMQCAKLLDEALTKRRSVKSISLMLKVDCRRMSRLLPKLGLVLVCQLLDDLLVRIWVLPLLKGDQRGRTLTIAASVMASTQTI